MNTFLISLKNAEWILQTLEIHLVNCIGNSIFIKKMKALYCRPSIVISIFIKKKGFLKETNSHKSKNVSSLKNSTLHDHVVHTEQNENVGCPIAGVEIYS